MFLFILTKNDCKEVCMSSSFFSFALSTFFVVLCCLTGSGHSADKHVAKWKLVEGQPESAGDLWAVQEWKWSSAFPWLGGYLHYFLSLSFCVLPVCADILCVLHRFKPCKVTLLNQQPLKLYLLSQKAVIKDEEICHWAWNSKYIWHSNTVLCWLVDCVGQWWWCAQSYQPLVGPPGLRKDAKCTQHLHPVLLWWPWHTADQWR